MTATSRDTEHEYVNPFAEVNPDSPLVRDFLRGPCAVCGELEKNHG